MATLIQDARYGLRMLRKSSGFTAVAMVTLALGIGANTAVFSVLDAALLRPLHFGNPNSLVLVWENEPAAGVLRNPVSPALFFDWEEQNRCFSGMAAFAEVPMNLTGVSQPEQVDVERVSPNFFSVLGSPPLLGRGFFSEEGRPGKSNVAVLSHAIWESQFGGDPAVIGKSIQLNGQSITVVGVAAPDFDFYIREHSPFGERPQLWAPLEAPPEWRRHDRSNAANFLRVVARLNSGVSVSQAQAQMNVVAENLAARYPEYDKGLGVALVSLRDQLFGGLRTPLFLLLGAVGLVLLIACANLASLLLSRASGRQNEIAIRLALGASRGRIARQFVMETLLLSLLGGAAGVFVAVWATKSLIHAGSGDLPYLSAGTVDWRMLAFAAGVTLLAGSLAGLLPSWMAARGEGLSHGRRASASTQSLAARNAFVMVEISMALVLLAGSSLLIKSFFRLTGVNPGFRVEHLLTFQVTLPDSKYEPAPARVAFFSQLLGQIEVAPGVTSATADLAPPFAGLGLTAPVAIAGESPRENSRTLLRIIEPGYFRTMGIPLLSGRTFSEREASQPSSVAIVNSAFAAQYFHGQNPLGQKITILASGGTNLAKEIVGVAGDVHESSLASNPRPLAYWPYPELPYKVMTIVVRTVNPPLSVVPAIREALHRIDKDQPMAKISSMDQLVENSVANSRFITLLLSVFAGLALLLACVGIYGLMAYSVAQRTREIGIRMALGAEPTRVMRQILKHGLSLALAAVAIGTVASLALTRLMSSLLFGVSPTDPATFSVVAVLLVAVSLAACYVPARRAMRVDPVTALRSE
jgi:putative ABC transport system permease protein